MPFAGHNFYVLSSFTSTLKLKTHSQLTQSPFTGTDCLSSLKTRLTVSARYIISAPSSTSADNMSQSSFLDDVMLWNKEECHRQCQVALPRLIVSFCIYFTLITCILLIISHCYLDIV